MTNTNVPQEKRRYSEEMLLMGGCPNCGQDTNCSFVEGVIDRITDRAIQEERQRIVKKRDDIWSILCEMDTNIKSEKEYANELINLIHKE